ncbi:MAG: carboxypeptidase-like regulatory domain-containing protein [Flammeovirgaceae bacterium]
MRYYTTIFFIFLSYASIQAQVTISGKVLHHADSTPVKGIQVFIANTLLANKTNAQGRFQIDRVPLGKQEIVIISPNFQQKVIVKEFTQKESVELRVYVVKRIVGKKELRKDGSWKRNYKRFEKAFLGDTPNAHKCGILNPTVVSFTQEGGTLIATANEPIRIRNEALGYEVGFLLEHFQMKELTVSYGGKSFFKELVSRNAKEQKKWIKNREKAYNGSFQHFLHALQANRISEQGFEIYRAEVKHNRSGFETKQELQLSDVYVKEDNQLQFKGFLRVIYLKEKEEQAYLNSQSNIDGNSTVKFERSGRGEETGRADEFQPNIQRVAKSGPQSSYVYALKQPIPLDVNGFLKDPQLVKEYGYWAWGRIAELMPKEYRSGVLK